MVHVCREILIRLSERLSSVSFSRRKLTTQKSSKLSSESTDNVVNLLQNVNDTRSCKVDTVHSLAL